MTTTQKMMTTLVVVLFSILVATVVAGLFCMAPLAVFEACVMGGCLFGVVAFLLMGTYTGIIE